MRLIGYFNGVPIYEHADVPANTIYFINNELLVPCGTIAFINADLDAMVHDVLDAQGESNGIQ
jgi:hypothetical protein